MLKLLQLASLYSFVIASAGEALQDELGRVSIGLNPAEMSSHKYDKIIDTRTTKPAQSTVKRLKESIFGKSIAKRELEQDVEDLLSAKSKQVDTHKKLGATFRKSTISLKDLIWTGTIYMGNSLTPVTVIFDTSSDWLLVEDAACGSCTGNTYHANRGRLVSAKRETLEYGKIEFTTLQYRDTVCVETTQCMLNYEYLAIQT